jgi:hypothetical protein
MAEPWDAPRCTPPPCNPLLCGCVTAPVCAVWVRGQVRAAISGEAFFAAGRSVVGLLSRNAMDAFGVW